MKNRIFLIAPALAALIFTARAGIFADDASGQARLIKVSAAGQGQAAAGLKEALAHATVQAVDLTGRPDGYFKDAAIKILLPHQMKPLETGLRAIGYGPKIDQFVLSMNRAAEAAAPKAEPIFERAIGNMSFSDAQRIVTGGGHSATDYFKAKTSDDLRTAFAPIVKKTMAEYSVTKQYDDLLAHYQSGAMGLGGLLGGMGQSFDLNNYVVQKSLDGLFYVVGQQEVKIRTNPAAQVTPLLRQVFGGLGRE